MKIPAANVLRFKTPTSNTDVPPGWPVKAGEAAWRGPVGEYAAAIEPYTEADPHAILISALVGVGNIFGRKAFWKVGSDVHYANLFAFIVGPTAIGRKGLSWKEGYHLIRAVDPKWPVPARGLSSGEGLINVLRDDSQEKKPTSRRKGEPPVELPLVPGVLDKRCLVIETEFGRPLRAMTRQGNTLMNVLNDAWDSSDLRVMTKNQPITATNPHISMIGHITNAELKEMFSRANDVPIWNGFANRWLWTCARSTRDIPSPIDFSSRPEAIKARLAVMKSVQWVLHGNREFVRSKKAGEWWDTEIYPDLKHNRTDDKFGAATTRALPLVMRMAMIYAALDRSPTIKVRHLESGLAVWRRCEASARYIFNLHDPDADSQRTRKLSHALQQAGVRGLTRKSIFKDVFDSNLSKDQLDAMLKNLHTAGFAAMQEERPRTGQGRNVERWRWIAFGE